MKGDNFGLFSPVKSLTVKNYNKILVDQKHKLETKPFSGGIYRASSTQITSLWVPTTCYKYLVTTRAIMQRLSLLILAACLSLALTKSVHTTEKPCEDYCRLKAKITNTNAATETRDDAPPSSGPIALRYTYPFAPAASTPTAKSTRNAAKNLA
nr:uncharacterized protein LOC113803715 [Penaeus vannamei]